MNTHRRAPRTNPASWSLLLCSLLAIGGCGGGGGDSAIATTTTGPERVAKLAVRPNNATCVAPPSASTVDNDMKLLSQTGCFTSTATHEVKTGVIAYTVNTLLWTDGEKKGRYFAIPNGTTITLVDDAITVGTANSFQNARFDFPVGSVIIKTFTSGTTRVETRLLMRHADVGGNPVWGAYSYEWNGAQTDATLLTGPTGKTVGSHYFPSRTECMDCHTASAKVALGPETLQLNYTQYYTDNTDENYLDALNRLGYFTANNSHLTYKTDRLYAVNDTSATLTQRARSYLHANCSGCHRTGETPGGLADFRYNRKFDNAANVCNVVPNATQPSDPTFGIPSARVILPGVADASIVTVRLNRTDGSMMPPLGRSTVDTEAVSAITSWINSLTACD